MKKYINDVIVTLCISALTVGIYSAITWRYNLFHEMRNNGSTRSVFENGDTKGFQSSTLASGSPVVGVSDAEAKSELTELSGWQTYSGSNYTIQFPPGWYLLDPIESHEAGGIFEDKMANGESRGLSFEIHRDGRDWNAYYLEYSLKEAGGMPDTTIATSTVSVAGGTGTKIDIVSRQATGGYEESLYVLLQKGSIQYDFFGDFYTDDSNRQAIFDDFLSSFVVR